MKISISLCRLLNSSVEFNVAEFLMGNLRYCLGENEIMKFTMEPCG